MKKILALGMTTALLTSSLMGSAAFADGGAATTKDSTTNKDIIEASFDDFEDYDDKDFNDDDYLKYFKDILSKEDFQLFEKYEKEIEAAFETESQDDDDAAFKKSDKLLEKYEPAMLKAEKAFTAKEIFEIYGDDIKADNKSKIEALAKTLEGYRAAGDVKNFDKTFEELEKLLPEFEDDDFNDIDGDFDDNESDMDGDYSEEITIEEVKEMYPSMTKEDLAKIETIITEYNNLSETDKDSKMDSFYDEFDKIAAPYETFEDDDFSLEDLYECSGKELSATEKTQIKSLYEELIKLEDANDFENADKIYEKLDAILFE